MTTTTTKETKEQQIDAYVKQGIDRETATRVVNAKPAKSYTKGSLNGNKGFSLLK